MIDMIEKIECGHPEAICMIDFDIIGDIPEKTIRCFTTRPDTLFGFSFLAISVDHPLSKYYKNNKDFIKFKDKCSKSGTTEESISSINNVLNNVVANLRSINLSLSGTGSFPERGRANTLWVGVKGELDELEKLIYDINNKLELLGFPKDNREFLPHVTVGRINPNQKKKPDISNFLNSIFMELPMKIVKIHLMQSQSFPKGSFYTILGSHFLCTKLE